MNNAKQRHARRALAVAVCGLVTLPACKSGSATTATTTTAAAPTPTTLSAFDYGRSIGDGIHEMGAAVTARQSAADGSSAERDADSRVADAARDIRLELQGAGTPPSVVKVVSEALLEAVQRVEDAFRASASCYANCADEYGASAEAMRSFNAALQNFTDTAKAAT